MNQGSGGSDLKYLGFFPAAATSVCLYLLRIYEAAKEQAGPLRPGVEDIEVVLKAFVKPVIRIADKQSTKLLDYVDKKVDENLKLVDAHIPAFLKPMAFYAQQIIFRADPMATMNTEALGLEVPTSSNAGVYYKEHCMEYWKYETFRKFVTGLHLNGIVRMLGPGAIYSADLFNQFASSLRDAHIPFSSHIPEVPVQALEKALKISCRKETWQPWQLYECEGAC